MKNDNCAWWLSVPVLLTFSVSACTTNPDGTATVTQKAVFGAAIGAASCSVAGAVIAKNAKKGALAGAAACGVIGAAAGAIVGYIDKEIKNNQIMLSQKMEAELLKIKANLQDVEERSNESNQILGQQHHDIRDLKNRSDLYERDTRDLKRYLVANSDRTRSTLQAINNIETRIEQINDGRGGISSENIKLKNTLAMKNKELKNQNFQLSKQRRIISSLLSAIDQKSRNSQQARISWAKK